MIEPGDYMKRFAILGIGMALGLGIVLAAWLSFNQNYTYQGVLIDPPARAADFTLTDQHGNPFQLSQQRGKIVLIFFGYTNCPDVCPMTLAEFKKIKAALGDQAANVRFVLITTDPARDTQERMLSYLSAFDPDFIGLTGEISLLEAIWKSYGVFIESEAESDPSHHSDDYTVDHSARSYLIDLQGNWRLNYPFGMDTEKISQDILHLLSEK
jgi:protein SCO1/2